MEELSKKPSPIQVFVSKEEREVYREASVLKAEELGVKKLPMSHYFRYLADKDVARLKNKFNDNKQ